MWVTMRQAPTIFLSFKLKFILRLAVRVAANAFCGCHGEGTRCPEYVEGQVFGHHGSRCRAAAYNKVRIYWVSLRFDAADRGRSSK
jgi:hypothetical protein